MFGDLYANQRVTWFSLIHIPLLHHQPTATLFSSGKVHTQHQSRFRSTNALITTNATTSGQPLHTRRTNGRLRPPLASGLRATGSSQPAKAHLNTLFYLNKSFNIHGAVLEESRRPFSLFSGYTFLPPGRLILPGQACGVFGRSIFSPDTRDAGHFFPFWTKYPIDSLIAFLRQLHRESFLCFRWRICHHEMDHIV